MEPPTKTISPIYDFSAALLCAAQTGDDKVVRELLIQQVEKDPTILWKDVRPAIACAKQNNDDVRPAIACAKQNNDDRCLESFAWFFSRYNQPYPLARMYFEFDSKFHIQWLYHNIDS